jgi:hypothetical protein
MTTPRRAQTRPKAPPAFGRDRAGDSSLSVILLVGIVIVLAAAFVVFTQVLRKQPHDPVESGGKATFTSEGYYLEPSGPDDIPVAGSTLFITLDGAQQAVPLSTFQSQIGGPVWTPGIRICIVGAAAGCYAAAAHTVDTALFSDREYVFAVTTLRTQSPAFQIGSGSNGIVVASGTWDVRLSIVGAQITCGSAQNAPDIPVTAKYSSDGGASYTTLFGGATLNGNGGQSVDLGQVPSGSRIGVQGRATLASCGNFDATYDSFSGSDHVLILKQGDPAPNKPAYAGQGSLASFMQPYVNTVTQTMVLDANQVILLYEFSGDLSQPAADFQDLVVLFTFT